MKSSYIISVIFVTLIILLSEAYSKPPKNFPIGPTIDLPTSCYKTYGQIVKDILLNTEYNHSNYDERRISKFRENNSYYRMQYEHVYQIIEKRLLIIVKDDKIEKINYETIQLKLEIFEAYYPEGRDDIEKRNLKIDYDHFIRKNQMVLDK